MDKYKQLDTDSSEYDTDTHILFRRIRKLLYIGKAYIDATEEDRNL